MKIIPAIDILGGQCVRLTKGDYKSAVVYSDDPVEVAMRFEASGFNRIHLVDLDGAREKHIVNYGVLQRIKKATQLNIDFGGGVKSGRDLQMAFDNGADMVNCGSVAVQAPVQFLSWLQRYGPSKIILSADAREGKVAISGWTEATDLPLESFIRYFTSAGLEQVICTSIDRDGMLHGPDLGLYKTLCDKFPGIALTASGGVGSLDDLDALAEIGVSSVVVGKAIYEGKLPLDNLMQWMRSRVSKANI